MILSIRKRKEKKKVKYRKTDMLCKKKRDIKIWPYRPARVWLTEQLKNWIELDAAVTSVKNQHLYHPQCNTVLRVCLEIVRGNVWSCCALYVTGSHFSLQFATVYFIREEGVSKYAKTTLQGKNRITGEMPASGSELLCNSGIALILLNSCICLNVAVFFLVPADKQVGGVTSKVMRLS